MLVSPCLGFIRGAAPAPDEPCTTECKSQSSQALASINMESNPLQQQYLSNPTMSPINTHMFVCVNYHLRPAHIMSNAYAQRLCQTPTPSVLVLVLTVTNTHRLPQDSMLDVMVQVYYSVALACHVSYALYVCHVSYAPCVRHVSHAPHALHVCHTPHAPRTHPMHAPCIPCHRLWA